MLSVRLRPVMDSSLATSSKFTSDEPEAEEEEEEAEVDALVGRDKPEEDLTGAGLITSKSLSSSSSTTITFRGVPPFVVCRVCRTGLLLDGDAEAAAEASFAELEEEELRGGLRRRRSLFDDIFFVWNRSGLID